jgi:hypothetical protein
VKHGNCGYNGPNGMAGNNGGNSGSNGGASGPTGTGLAIKGWSLYAGYLEPEPW